MATRKTATQIDPITVIAFALKAAKTKSDYSRIITANQPTDIQAAWASLSSEDQQRISNICNDSPQPDLNAIADEIIGVWYIHPTAISQGAVRGGCSESGMEIDSSR